MFQKAQPNGYREVIDGIRMKTLVYGRNTLMAEYRMKTGSQLPAHQHPHEQTGYMIAGELELTIGDQTQRVGPGDSWCIPGDTVHSAEVVAEAIAVEVFSPVREDFLPEAD